MLEVRYLHLEWSQVQRYKSVELHLVRHRFHRRLYLGQVGLFQCHLRQHSFRYRFLQRLLIRQRHHRYQQLGQVLVPRLHHNRLVIRLLVHHRLSLQDFAG